MTNETYRETEKMKSGHIFETDVTVRYGEAVSLESILGHLRQTPRWVEYLRDEVAMVRSVEVSRSAVYASGMGVPVVSRGYEILFKCGARGWVNGEAYELDGLVVGGKGYIHGLAVWKKYGRTRGSSVFWFMAQKGARKRLNVDRAPRCCAAELYARAAGKSWG